MTRRASGEEDLEVPSGCTRADGAWRATAAKPPDRWQFADFDDSSWQVLGACSTAPDGLESWALDRLNELIGLGSVPLAIPRGPHIWIRRRFELPR